MQDENQTTQVENTTQDTIAEFKNEETRKPRKTLKVLLVIFLMLCSFVIGWRFMAYSWWPVISPYVKQAVYAVIPSLKPEEVVAAPVEEYHPRCDAKVGDPIGPTDSVFYYFYFPTCPYCQTNGNMILAGLPEYITLEDGTRSRVVMIPLNKHDDAEYEYIAAYYESHGVIKNEEQNDQIVPSIVIGDTYLRGSYQIRDNFYKMLLNGDGLKTELIDGSARVE